nr:hypothetical protein HmN_000632100 [Hymenolepis microstoma]
MYQDMVSNMCKTCPQQLQQRTHENDLGLLNYIINSHKNPPSAPRDYGGRTPECVRKTVPSVNEKISQMVAETIGSIIVNISNIPAYLEGLELPMLKEMIVKVTLLGELIPKSSSNDKQ